MKNHFPFRGGCYGKGKKKIQIKNTKLIRYYYGNYRHRGSFILDHSGRSI